MENLKVIRLESNLTQLQLQMKIGIDQALLSKYENGERTPTLLVKSKCRKKQNKFFG